MSCAISKSKQKNVSKVSRESPKDPGDLIYLDISSIKSKSIGGSKFWLLIVDGCTDMCWSFFLQRKSQTKTVVLQFLKDLRSKSNMTVKKIRCDNAGENKKLQELCDTEGLGIIFEYSAPGSPQYNGVVERKFPTLQAKVRAMLNAARLPLSIRSKLWAECGLEATKLENGILMLRS
jgi:transposase InsO family protein